MKYSILLAMLLNLTGCTYQSVNDNDISAANKLCAAENSTVVSISAVFDGREIVTCSNRKTYRLD